MSTRQIDLLTQVLATLPNGHSDRSGMIRAIEVLRTSDVVPGTVNRNDMCHCDGPAHPYSPGWCPATGPRSGR